ncbi:UNVERIFIED_CONTAM: hypothetical protein GTU68_052478 [Idotea baltica]|nr:hypothetical protein [Idotea baltica]
MEEKSVLIKKIIELSAEYLPKVGLSLLTLFIGLYLISVFAKGFNKFLNTRNIDRSLCTFLSSLISIALKIILFISIAGMLGIQMTSLIALLGAAGIAFGMALSGTLQNFAGGILILFLKPYRVGDFIEAQGFSGKVKEILIFNTILNTVDNKTVVIPNSPLATEVLINYTAEGIRRLDLTIGVSYDSSIDKTREVIKTVLDAETRIIPEKDVVIAVEQLADSSINFAVRVWVKSDDYIALKFALLEAIKKEFDQNEIKIPFPSREVFLKNI